MQPASGAESPRRCDDWADYAARVGLTDGRLPDFLVVAPPKTGTTWLAAQLSRHPAVLVPPEKEVRYFDRHWRSQGLGWYCARFPAAPGQIAGDVTPGYALLPSTAIAHIGRLKPEMKLIVLLRDPIARAWSHLKHTFRHGEANFAGTAPTVDSVAELPLAAMLRNLIDDYTLSSGDYVSIMRRWLAVFPRRQMHVAFLEEIEAAPVRTLEAITDFLGVEPMLPDQVCDMPSNPGLPGAPPETLAPFLAALFGPRQRAATRFLAETMAIAAPWQAPSPEAGEFQLDGVLGHAAQLRNGRFHHPRRLFGPSRWFAGATDFIGEMTQRPTTEDRRLARVLDALGDPLEPQPTLIESRDGCNLVQWRDQFYALRQNPGPFDLRQGMAALREHAGPGGFGVGTSPQQAWSMLLDGMQDAAN